MCIRDRGRFDEAQKEFLRATEARDPKVKESAFYNMGNSFFRLERYKEAVEAYKRALGTDPHDVRAKWNLELALRRLKEEEQKKQGRNDKDQKNDQKDQGQKDSPSAEQKPPPPDKEPQKRPPEVPPPKDAKNDKSPSPNERAQAPQEKPVDKQDAEAVLDALERGEKNLELQQAQLRARGRRRPEKDY